MDKLKEYDIKLYTAVQKELERERNTLELIASENFTSEYVLDIVGSILTNKYAEGYPGKRYYGGCEHVDVAESLAIDRAKRNNMPADTIDRAVKRAGGDGESQERLEEIFYEGYGPGGAAIILHAITSNRNRTASEVRSTFAKGGANLGATGCVSWNFEFKGVITAEVQNDESDEVALAVIDAGADDFRSDGSYLEVYANANSLEILRTTLQDLGVNVTSAEMSMVPLNTISVKDKVAGQTLRLIDQLEDLDDIQKVYTNADFAVEFLEQFSG